jgi:acyl carrier protein phosphodiesterase
MRIWRHDFAHKQQKLNNDSFYDIQDDYALIEASFLQQYGIRLRTQDDLSWDEFITYLSGLDDKTPLGRIVAIRSEKDPKIIKNMSPEQKAIRSKWRNRQLQNYTPQDLEALRRIQYEMAAGMRSRFCDKTK